jgi:2-oxoglutarate dehydrogenase E1 component
LIAERQKLGTKDVAIVRVEQLSPWPFNALKDTLQKYNNGVWSFAEPRFRNQLKAL